jgi:hypothetical protein
MSLPTPPAGNPSDDLLRNLVDAMRRVAEEARDRQMAALRDAVKERTEELMERDGSRIAELRERAEQEISGIGDWERAELERVREEAVYRVDARRHQLEQQLAEMGVSVEIEITAVKEMVAKYEKEIAAFFAQLADVSDPAAFAAAARRMPVPPSPDKVAPSAPFIPTAVSDEESPESKLSAAADEEVPSAETDGQAAAEDEPPGRDAKLAAQLAELDVKLASAETNGGEVTTSILVTGLGSFGAITSFKQALERADGIRNVSLGLAPAGEEFVYRATHAPGLDLPATIRAIEGEGTEIRETDGALRVLVSHTG